MLVIILGPPASGKTLYSRLINKDYGLFHFSPGVTLREKAVYDIEIQGYLNSGQIVPENISNQIVEDELKKREFNVLLDGYPRSVTAAQFLDLLLSSFKKNIAGIIELETPMSVIEQRILNRFICFVCNNSYGENVLCCLENTVRRGDDNLESLKLRMKFHNKQCELIRKHYSTIPYFSVNTDGDPKFVYSKIKNVLNQWV